MNHDALDDDIASRLRTADQRYTSGRRRLVAVLCDGARPMTINQILAGDTTLAQSSIYRNLSILEQVGVVTRIVTSDDFAHYELAEGLTDHHHHHLICSACGSVSDFSLKNKIEDDLERALRTVARQSGFAADGHRLDLMGVCSSCR